MSKKSCSICGTSINNELDDSRLEGIKQALDFIESYIDGKLDSSSLHNSVNQKLDNVKGKIDILKEKCKP